jgi:hypothetical protein
MPGGPAERVRCENPDWQLLWWWRGDWMPEPVREGGARFPSALGDTAFVCSASRHRGGATLVTVMECGMVDSFDTALGIGCRRAAVCVRVQRLHGSRS